MFIPPATLIHHPVSKMPKRKRDDQIYTQPIPSTNRILVHQRKSCAKRLEVAQKDLLSALRFSAGFERQKFSRRKKTAKENNDEKAKARLEAEYAALKGLDLHKVAEQHLRKTIARVKSIRDAEALPRETKEVEKGSQDPAMLNVLARLYKGVGVKKVMDEIIEELKVILDVGQNTEHNTKDKKSRVGAVEEEERNEDSAVDDDENAFAMFNSRIAAPSSAEEDNDDSLSEGNRPPSIDASEGDSEYSLSEGMCVDKESEDESSSEAVDPTTLAFSESESEPQTKPKYKTGSKASQNPLSKSTFLPSLSHAAYYSGSDSEASDLDADFAPRKNRRGQKARQKIWEAKYGDKAKHKEKADRNKGWDAKRGAVDEKGRRRKGGHGSELSGENAVPLGRAKKETKRDDAGVLHPSWLAAKAAKEKKMVIKPEGKKIVFD